MQRNMNMSNDRNNAASAAKNENSNTKKVVSNPNIDGLLKIVAAKLNMKPDVLRQQLEEGQFEDAIKNMNKNDSAKFQQILKNPNIAEKIMSAPQAKSLYNKLMNDEKK
ncbi:MAG: hypothetical protein Q4F95_10380 [Oscillospiraceae bacterium]|nr:hypothetical protein [Oscillospiraceae bacterium]